MTSVGPLEVMLDRKSKIDEQRNRICCVTIDPLELNFLIFFFIMHEREN